KARIPRDALALVALVPFLARTKIVRVSRDLVNRELEVVAFAGDGLDERRGVEAIAAEAAGRLGGEPDPRLAEGDRVRPSGLELRGRPVELRPGQTGRLDAGAGADRVDGDVVRSGLERERLHEPLDAVLDRAVRDLLPVAAEARAARDADDVAAALRPKLRPRGVGAVEHATEADVDLARPFG